MAEPSVVAQAAGAARAPDPEKASAPLQLEPPRKVERRGHVLVPSEALEPSPVLEEGYVESAPAAPAVAPLGPPEWERLAESGDFGAAKVALDREGGFDWVVGSASAGELMSLADIARTSGRREQALSALRRVLTAYVSAPEAPVAAWTLGNLLDQAGDKQGAAEAYATYRRLSPTGDFAEDAAARQVDVALSQGNFELGLSAIAGDKPSASTSDPDDDDDNSDAPAAPKDEHAAPSASSDIPPGKPRDPE